MYPLIVPLTIRNINVLLNKVKMVKNEFNKQKLKIMKQIVLGGKSE